MVTDALAKEAACSINLISDHKKEVGTAACACTPRSKQRYFHFSLQ